MALLDCSQQYVWTHSMLSELGYKFGPVNINGDNQGSIFMASNPITESRNKHIDVHFHAICDFVTQGKIKLFYIEGNKNPADLFTKNLGQVKFHEFWPDLLLKNHCIMYRYFLLAYIFFSCTERGEVSNTGYITN